MRNRVCSWFTQIWWWDRGVAPLTTAGKAEKKERQRPQMPLSVVVRWYGTLDLEQQRLKQEVAMALVEAVMAWDASAVDVVEETRDQGED
ncbi:hypothetical protein NDU88_010225 [Pleurodeles waltl]|uniref:Uncharacterized protein n=1 Tax=Pleurodeles waltl TaxID=8319 RepID=A0AAV7PVB2_PLEWA|nr:hypothetical protein NDU88_010225 [Pleurodeles waltl]